MVVSLVKQLASSGQKCNACKFYCHEPVPQVMCLAMLLKYMSITYNEFVQQELYCFGRTAAAHMGHKSTPMLQG